MAEDVAGWVLASADPSCTLERLAIMAANGVVLWLVSMHDPGSREGARSIGQRIQSIYESMSDDLVVSWFRYKG